MISLLSKIKIETIQKGITMTELSNQLGISREYMYRKIKSQDNDLLERIKKILSELDTNVSI